MKQIAIAVIGTADTKGEELDFIKDLVQSYGITPMVIDVGILGEPIKVVPDVSRHDVAAAGGHTIASLIARGSRGAAVDGMREGLSRVVRRLYENGEIDGMLAIGGAEGSILAAAAMAVLPLGVPKLTVSPIASGQHKFKEIIGHNDALVMHSVIDILGLNDISMTVFENAVAALAGMVRAKHHKPDPNEKRVAISMLGTVTKPIMNVIKPRLEEKGYKIYTFHANGVGGDCMDNLINQGYFCGVIDYALNELVGMNLGGFHVSSRQRMEAALKKGIPTVVVPGVTNILVTSTAHSQERCFDGRMKYYHNPEIVLIGLTEAEMDIISDTLVEKLNGAADKAKVKVMVPLMGLCSQDKEGLALHNPSGNKVLFNKMRRDLKYLDVTEMDTHINENSFAEAVCEAFFQLMKLNG
jgi:uncharacterized protein (UPF0261 family)